MGVWFADNWFTVLSSVGIIASLLFAAQTIRESTKAQRIANLLTVTQGHRDMWKIFIENASLGRVFDPSADLRSQPITNAEEMFATLVLVHLSSVFLAMKGELFVAVEGLRRDVASFFALPIPSEVWQKMKGLQNKEFADFVSQSLEGKEHP